MENWDVTAVYQVVRGVRRGKTAQCLATHLDAQPARVRLAVILVRLASLIAPLPGEAAMLRANQSAG